MNNVGDPYQQRDQEYAMYYVEHGMDALLKQFIKRTMARGNHQPDHRRYLYIYYLRKIKRYTYKEIARIAEVNAKFAQHVYRRVDFSLNGINSDVYRSTMKTVYYCNSCQYTFHVKHGLPERCTDCGKQDIRPVTKQEFHAFLALREEIEREQEGHSEHS